MKKLNIKETDNVKRNCQINCSNYVLTLFYVPHGKYSTHAKTMWPKAPTTNTVVVLHYGYEKPVHDGPFYVRASISVNFGYNFV